MFYLLTDTQGCLPSASLGTDHPTKPGTEKLNKSPQVDKKPRYSNMWQMFNNNTYNNNTITPNTDSLFG